jgi:hypothetical protein
VFDADAVTPLFCSPDMERAHEELRALGRSAGQATVRSIAAMELPIEQARDPYAIRAAITQTLIDAYMVDGQPAFVAILRDLERHAVQRIEELINEQQTCEASAASPS